MPATDVLGRFSTPTAEWFRTTFGSPTPAQEQGWPAIADGDHTLVLAPTGSGKTLAAFLWAIDRLSNEPIPDQQARTRVVYLSPLRALAVDIEKNLRAPLAGIRLAGERLGIDGHEPTVGIRTGDTAANERRSLIRHPPDILITTPESLYLMLTSRARETLANVDTVIIDEIHAVAGTKRGSHLALTLERLEAVCETPPQRIGLSATQRPLDEIARFLGGYCGRAFGRARIRAGRPTRTAGAGSAGGHRRRRRAQGARSRGHRAHRGHGSPRRGDRGTGVGSDRRWPAPALDLAGDPPPAPRPGARTPLHHRVRQQPATGRTARHPAERAPSRADRRGRRRRGEHVQRRRRPWPTASSWCAPTTGRSVANSASSSRIS